MTNYISALFNAINQAVQAGQNQQLADGSMVMNEVKTEEKIENSWTFKLQGSEQYGERPTGFQSWMSVGALRSMEKNERNTLTSSYNRLVNSYHRDMSNANSCFNDARHSSRPGSDYNQGISWQNDANALVSRMNKDHAMLGQGGNLSTTSEVKNAFAYMMQNGLTSRVNGSYVNHIVTSATLSTLANHVASLGKANASQTTIGVAEQIYHQAQTEQQQAVQGADSGVQAAQNQVTQDSTNNQQKAMLVNSLMSLLQQAANMQIT
jgi:hypothetical protein